MLFFKKDFNVALTDLTDKMGVLSIQGPKSRKLLQNLIDSDMSDESFPYLTTKLVHVAGHLCRAMRISYVGELGWELHIPWDSCIPVFKAICEEGKNHGLRHAGYRALHSLGSEKGSVFWNTDIRMDDNPLEAGLTKMCRPDGNYLGKKALEAYKRNGVKKMLAFFQIEEKVPVWGLETIWRDDAIVGYLRRGEYGYALDSSIGRGYVAHPEGKQVTSEFLTTGKYQVEVMGNKIDATVHLKSPFDPENSRVKGLYNEAVSVSG